MLYDINKIKLPKGVSLVEHIQDEKLLFEKGGYEMEFIVFSRVSIYSGNVEYLVKTKFILPNKTTLFDDDSWLNEKLIKSKIKFFNNISNTNENVDLPTPAELVKSLGFGMNSINISGTKRVYFFRRCVVTYAKDSHSCYMIIKMRLGGYKGLRFIGHVNFYFSDMSVREISLKDCYKNILEIKNQTITYNDISEEDRLNMVSKMV